MTSRTPPQQSGKPRVSDTRRTAPPRMLLWTVVLAIVVVAILIASLHFIGMSK
jgi:hypothetical protein